MELLGHLVLAAGNVRQEPDPDTVSPGFLGFVVVFALAVATALLIRSMVAHLRKVRYSPEPPEAGDRRPPST